MPVLTLKPFPLPSGRFDVLMNEPMTPAQLREHFDLTDKRLRPLRFWHMWALITGFDIVLGLIVYEAVKAYIGQ